MKNVLFLQGGSALSVFKLSQKLKQLQIKFPQIVSLQANYGYFAHLTHPLSKYDIQTLESLLSATISKIDLAKQNSAVFWVIPRTGTLSPWASKATHIAHICELKAIQRIERGICFEINSKGVCDQLLHENIGAMLHDPMTESLIVDSKLLMNAITTFQPADPIKEIDLLSKGFPALEAADRTLGLGLSVHDMDYLIATFQKMGRNPTDVELMMFAQVNSEHCRHHLFNAEWTLDRLPQNKSLFAMIRNTFEKNPGEVLLAYRDNAAILKGVPTRSFVRDFNSHHYHWLSEPLNIVFKVETHNHPTAISPFPGAATGSGGELRDEAATGRGAEPLAGLVGFSVSHLHIPDFNQPWEYATHSPRHIASALNIMLSAPIGAAAFNNEFGRPNLCGYFRTLQVPQPSHPRHEYGYHKPIMIAGGIGHIRPMLTEKKTLPLGAQLVVLGGPALSIGLGGGSASSHVVNDEREALDFASVQRANPEMQRRAQEVIAACCSLGDDNPILNIHDVGAGGLSNALPELVAASQEGALIHLRAILSDDSSMSPLAIWCNESQERFVIAIESRCLELFKIIADRERCPFSVVGEITSGKALVVKDDALNTSLMPIQNPVDLPLSVLFPNKVKLRCEDQHIVKNFSALDLAAIQWEEAVRRVLQYPCVADKSFLITIGDRTVGGLVARDQMVGPWQVPVSDVAAVCNDYLGFTGQALAMGERAPIALLHSAASARMSVGEAITNIAAAPIEDISKIVLSANWMASAHSPGEAAALYDAVEAIGMELCPALGICIPVGKDSLSMKMSWQEEEKNYSVTSPVSLIISATAPISDVRYILTPQLVRDSSTQLILIDLGKGLNLLGGSVLGQVYQMLATRPPDLDNPQLLKDFFDCIQELREKRYILAYHDRSDGGLLVTLCEMAFAGHCGINIDVTSLGSEPKASLFCEELGAVFQVNSENIADVHHILKKYGLLSCSHVIGRPNEEDQIIIKMSDQLIYQASRIALQRLWSETSYRMQAFRDSPESAQQQYDQLLDQKDPGLTPLLTFEMPLTVSYIHHHLKPKLAILREQGVNGHKEMAAAFNLSGFECVDVHMSDLLADLVDLQQFKGVIACGGFSYGDVLGAGRGWAQAILKHPKVRAQFENFFARSDSFSLGVCNGCQMLSQLKELIPGAEHWPFFERNYSQQFEARLSLVRILNSPSIFLRDMQGSILPVAVSHGEGKAFWKKPTSLINLKKNSQLSLQYIDNTHKNTEFYPANPNGSPEGLTGFTTPNGQSTILMPHPERVFRATQFSWCPKEWGDRSPWMKFFMNAREWVG